MFVGRTIIYFGFKKNIFAARAAACDRYSVVFYNDHQMWFIQVVSITATVQQQVKLPDFNNYRR